MQAARTLLSLPILAAVPLAAAGDGSRAPADEAHARDVRPFLERHCLECHAGAEPEAQLDLAPLLEPPRGAAARSALELVWERVEAGEMPPRSRPRPAAPERARFLAWIEEHVLPPPPLDDPGRPVARRLNAREYENAVRDLFGIEYPARERFPADEVGAGFDNSGDALALSELHLERLVEAAEEIAARALVDADPGEPPVRRYGAGELDGRAHGGASVLASAGDTGTSHDFPRAGRYRIRARAFAQQAGAELARMALVVAEVERARVEVAATRGASEPYEVVAELPAGPARIAARFLNDHYDPEHPDPAQRDRNLYVECLEVEGPLDAPEPTRFQRELLARFGPELGAGRLEALLGHLATRVWRRPAGEDELRRLAALAPRAPLEERLRLALAALLASPRFVLRLEPDPPGARGTRPLDGWELATRLSFFLWSSTPDERLQERAAGGELARSEVLEAEVARMLADARARALAEGFAAQWLQLGRLGAQAPERGAGEEQALRASMLAETLHFFEALVREERDLRELLDADWTIVDGRLARHYGLAESEQERARRVSLAGLPRRGLLGHASILTLTSNPTRTSPVARGKWILETLLGAPPPDPPPGVGALEEGAGATAGASLRARLELHRADPACAVCHDGMDPLGFALEGFGARGAERALDGASPVDTRGRLPDGRTFDGAIELAAVLRADGGLPRTLAERLFVYALGRGLERTDRPALRAILAGLDPEHPTIAALVRGIVLSVPFRERRIQ